MKIDIGVVVERFSNKISGLGEYISQRWKLMLFIIILVLYNLAIEVRQNIITCIHLHVIQIFNYNLYYIKDQAN